MAMHQELYKKGIDRVEQQQIRQQELLTTQKKQREKLQDDNRHLSQILKKIANETNCSKNNSRHRYKARTLQQRFGFNVSLQFSEWFRQPPENLLDWLLVPCPRGQRCLVVANHGRTDVYSKSGHRFMKFHSQLPGDGVDRRSLTILDCIYSQKEDCFYVLDALYYNNQDLIECEAQFRYFWLRSKFDEDEDLSERTGRNEKPFQLLETYDFENSTRIALALQTYPLWSDNKPELDGLLFYHKEASYTCGTTPLVCWLFPFMVPAVLGLIISDSYETPDDYNSDCPQDYMDMFDERIAMKKQQRWKQNVNLEAMDYSQSNVDDDDDNDTLKKLLDAERRLELGEIDECYEELQKNNESF